MYRGDAYCSISAIRWLRDPDFLLKDICNLMRWEKDAYLKIADPGLVEGLRLKEEDMAATMDLMLLCHSKKVNGQWVVYDDIWMDYHDDSLGYDDPARSLQPMFISETNGTPRWHVRPEEGAERTYTFHTEEGSVAYLRRDVIAGPVTFLLNYPAFLIVSGVSPTIKPHTLYDLLYHHTQHRWNPVSLGEGAYYGQPQRPLVRDDATNPLSCINHGPLVYTVGMEVNYAYLPSRGFRWKDLIEGTKTFWESILSDEVLSPTSVNDKLQEAWMGKGNLWCLASPNRFPIAETLAGQALVSLPPRDDGKDTSSSTFACLPLDVLLDVLQYLPPQDIATLLQLCYPIRRRLLPVVNSATYSSIRLHRPHLLPVGPFQFGHGCKRGREEVDYWAGEWAKGGVILDDSDWRTTERIGNTVPWLVYAREASKSPGMKNRRRIWGIGMQLEGMLEKLREAREADPSQLFLPTHEV